MNDQDLKTPLFQDLKFGEPEAENDVSFIADAFYTTDAWNRVNSNLQLPFVIGRKGSGKSAIAMRLEYISKQTLEYDVIQLVPAAFRHVEIRKLLSGLVNSDASWQYIYGKVWEGIILGQVVRHLLDPEHKGRYYKLSGTLIAELKLFQDKCSFYMSTLNDSLLEVIMGHLKEFADQKEEAVTLVELRKRLQPFTWESVIRLVDEEFKKENGKHRPIRLIVDGLDDHWDRSEPSLYFLAQLVHIIKSLASRLSNTVKFTICLRDNIFRTLVDTKCIEYDKIESSIINLKWNSRSLFELVAKRVACEQPNEKEEINALRNILPESINEIDVESFLGRYILNRPRDYINFFKLLQNEVGPYSRASEANILDVISRYKTNRLLDLDNEFGHTYPGIRYCVGALQTLPSIVNKDKLICSLERICSDATIRKEAAVLVQLYGQPYKLATILISIGVIGVFDPKSRLLRFIHEFSETRVSNIYEGNTQFGLHPVYSEIDIYSENKEQRRTNDIIVDTHPSDYIAEKESKSDLKSASEALQEKKTGLLANYTSIQPGNHHSSKFESWVKDSISISYPYYFTDHRTQVQNLDRSKRVELIFNISGDKPPIKEIIQRFDTHRLLVECKNTDKPSDADYSKLDRDQCSLQINVAFLVYRSEKLEPEKNQIMHQRSRYLNSDKKRVIIAVTDGFLKDLLRKGDEERSLRKLDQLWRSHLERWLVV